MLQRTRRVCGPGLFIRALVLLAALSGLAARAEAPLTAGRAADATPPKQSLAEPGVLRLGVLRFRDPEVVYSIYAPVLELIEAQTGMRVQAQVLDADGLEDAVREGRIDLLYTNPLHFLVLGARYPLGGVLATAVRSEAGVEANQLGGVVITQASRQGELHWRDLSRLSIAAPGPKFLGGYYTQLHELHRRGLSTPSRMHWVGTHDAVIQAVLDGEVDAGFVRSGVIEQLAAMGTLDPALLRVVEPMEHAGFPFRVSTTLYPEWPVVALPHVEPRLLRRVVAALMGVELLLPPSSGSQIAAFVPPVDYTAMTELAVSLRLPPFDTLPRGEWEALWQQHPLLMRSGHALALMVMALMLAVWLINRRLADQRAKALAAEAHTRVAEAYSRAVINALPDLLMVVDAEDRFIDVRGPEALLLEPPDALVGKTLDAVVGPELAERGRAQFAAARTTGEPAALSYSLDLPSGARWFESRASRLADGRVLCLVRDISAQQRAEQALRRESGFADLLVHLAASYINVPVDQHDAATMAALRRVAEYVQADRGYVFRIDADAGLISNTHEWCAPGIAPMIDRLQGQPIEFIGDWMTAFDRGENLQIEDVERYPDPVLRQHLQDQDIRSMLSVPMMHDGRCVGLVGFDSVRGRRSFSQRELQLLEAFALVQLNLQLQGQAAARIEEQRQRLEIIVEGTAAGTWIWWPRSGEVVFNERWASMLGYTLDELQPVSIATWQRLVHPDDLAMAERELQRNIAGEIDYYQAELRMRHRDGRWVWVLTRGRMVRNDEGPGGLIMAGIHQDIDARKQAEARLIESEQRFRSLLEELPTIAVQGYGPDLIVRFWNRGSERLYGWSREQAVGRSLLDLLIPPAQREQVRAEVAHWLASGTTIAPGPMDLLRQDGSLVPVYSSYALQRNLHGETELFCIDLDLTEQVQAAERLELWAKVFTHSHEGILITDPRGVILEVNDAFTKITGYSRDEALGRTPTMLSSGKHPPEHFAAMWAALLEEGHWSGEIWNRRRDGALYVEYLTISAVHDGAGQLTHYVGLFSDITTQKEYQHRLERIAHYDALTGLPNRVLLADRIRQAMAQARRTGKNLALAFIDLDGFKAVNDSHGHETGDQLLRRFGERLAGMLREGDTVARLGGDEFVALLVDVGPVDGLRRLLERMLLALREPIMIGELKLSLSGSIGVSMYPQDDELDAEQLLRQADQAMYRAKHGGKDRIGYFDSELERQYRQRAELQVELQRALEQRQFVLHYQPRADLAEGRVVGVEALLRWQHPERGLLLPGAFLPAIEAEPLGLQLGQWVLREAIADMAHWQAQGLRIGVSVNVAAQQILDAGFVDQLRQLLAAYPELPAGSLMLEVLETSLIGDMDQAAEVCQACNALGVEFSLDDFGIGYSSLSYLKALPLAELKIDRSFVRDMLVDPEDLAIVDGIIGLSRAFKLKVIAEGVESADQIEALLRLGCTLCQGHQIAAAMPVEELIAWAQAWRPEPHWAEIAPLQRNAFPLLLAEIEHRAWVQQVLAYAENPQAQEPPAPRGACRLGQRLEDLSPAVTAALDMPALEQRHDAIHALVDDWVPEAGEVNRFRSRLLDMQRELIAELRRGMQYGTQ